MDEDQLSEVVKSVIQKQQTDYFSLDRMEKVIRPLLKGPVNSTLASRLSLCEMIRLFK